MIIGGGIFILLHIFICLLLSSFMASLVYFFVYYSNFEFLGFIVVSIIYFFCYLFIAFPIQIILRRKPKIFSVKYLILYLLVSFFGTIILLPTLLEFSFTMHFSKELLWLSILNALIFWIIDSLVMRKDRIHIKNTIREFIRFIM
ncbi:UPF0715 family protein [Oceanobacillus iheyensis]|uniref:UPF0715 family protein n=1 Tax=Oceanobacillus iheyensis TaxID=182710 RepID=UPI00362F7FED